MHRNTPNQNKHTKVKDSRLLTNGGEKTENKGKKHRKQSKYTSE